MSVLKFISRDIELTIQNIIAEEIGEASYIEISIVIANRRITL